VGTKQRSSSSVHMETVSILGIPIACLTMAQVLAWVEKRIEGGKPAHVVTANAEIIYRAWREPHLAQLLRQADLITADGSGVVWASQKLKSPLPERVTGVDLTQHLLALAAEKGWRVYFLGAKPEVVKNAVLRTLSKYPRLQISGYQHGYFAKKEIEQVVSNINKVKPHLLFVALGAPKQDYFIQENLAQLATSVAIGVGGTFDVLAGTARRAPLWMQKRGLEWLYRLCQQPRRLGRMLALPGFVRAVWRQGKFSPD
jgi:N-acetylglucosaminyldiphosphoundecaprenol N-acetyl-beta-D-mannosaminyltransferase